MKTIAFLLLISNLLLSQDIRDIPCDFRPLQFQSEIQPIWSHLCIDSSLISYVDSTARWKEIYYDGMKQLGFDEGSFIHNGYLYSINEVIYDFDKAGSFIEKIDIDTGHKKWTIRTDLRHVKYREKIIDIQITDCCFIMRGIQCVEADSNMVEFDFDIGLSTKGTYFTRVYDLESGSVINEYSSSEEYLSPFEMSSRNTSYFIKEGEGNIQYFKKYSRRDEGIFIIRTVLDSLGIEEMSNDTVWESKYNDNDWFNAYYEFYLSNKFHASKDGGFIIIDQYIPDDTNQLQKRGTILKFDEDFVLLNEIDLQNWVEVDFSELTKVYNYNSDEDILLRACRNMDLSTLSSDCKPYYIVMDEDLNIKGQFDSNIDGEYYNTLSVCNSMYESLFFSSTQFVDNNNFKISVYELSNSGNHLNLTLEVEQPNWIAQITESFILENNDYLVKIVHGCYNSDSLDSSHIEWMRFAAEDIQLSTNTQELGINERYNIQLYPNPVSDLLNIKLDKSILGNITIVNAMGEVVLKSRLNNSSYLNLNTEDWPTGIYNVIVSGDEGIRSSVQFVKQ